ncbi:MAG: hypothetical protein AAFO07_00930 [Bacteroidota bacterium]
MENNKFFRLLDSISETDKALKDLQIFSQLSKIRLTTLDREILDFLISYYLNNKIEKKEKLLEPTILTKFFDNSDALIAKSKWSKAKNRLINMLQQFVVTMELEKHTNIKNRLLLNYFQDNQLDTHFNGYFSKAQKTLDQGELSFDKEYHQLKLEELNVKQEKNERLQNKNIETFSLTLDRFYFENKFRILAEQINRHRIIHTPMPDETIIRVFDKNIISESSIGLKAFYNIFSMMKDPKNEDYYQKIKALYYDNISQSDPSFNKTICDYLMNQCIHYVYQNKIEFAEDYLDLLKSGIDHGFIRPKKGLSSSQYHNIIYCGLICRDLNWIEDFVLKNTNFVKIAEKEALKQLNLTYISFYKGNKEEAKERLLKISVKDVYFKIILNKLDIKLQFETPSTIALPYKLEAFQKYLNRKNTISEKRKIKNYNFIKAVRDLGKKNGNSIELNSADFLPLDYLWLRNHINKT